MRTHGGSTLAMEEKSGKMQTREGNLRLIPGSSSGVTAPDISETWRRFLRISAIALCVTYLWWNLAWLWQREFPPAICQYLTGLPAPTTGCLRSIGAFCQGEWRESLRWNAMAVPLTLMLPVSAAAVALEWIRCRRARLPPVLFRVWCLLLGAAWLLQLANPRFHQ